jgi:MYXO-CTERM domain-containing protein
MQTRITILLAAITASTVSLGIIPALPAQAATINGTISGTWNFYASGNVNLNDPFTATYTYDDTQVVTQDLSNSGYTDIRHTVNLTSLVLVAGSLSHTFDVSTPNFAQLFWEELTYTAPYTPGTVKYLSLAAQDRTALGNPGFSAQRQVNDYPGYAFSIGLSAEAAGVDPITFERSQGLTYSDVIFNPEFPSTPTSVPTPALLPGLIVLGAALRRRRQKVCA